MRKMFGCLVMAVWCSLAACSRDPYRNYLGLWERNTDDLRVLGLGALGGGPWHEVVEIKRDGDTILFDSNALEETKQPNVLVQSEGQLRGGWTLGGGVALGLSEDKKTLMVGTQRYARIEPARLDEIRAQIVSEKQASKDKAARCAALQAQWQKERAAVQEARSGETDTALAAINERYQAQAKDLPRCSFSAW